MALPAFIRENIPLREMTTLRIGGPARLFAEPETMAELRRALEHAREAGLPVRALGGGSNLLVADSGVEAMVVRLPRRGEFAELVQDAAEPLRWKVGAAATLASLVAATARHGISGLEALAGIPGTVGGAAAMNCGSDEASVGESITKAFCCGLSGDVLELGAGELAFSYRHGRLGEGIATGFELRFAAIDSPGSAIARMNSFSERKRKCQPVRALSAGCFFKNPPGHSAGALIDAAGCKGMTAGDAEISSLHANFVVNRGRAACADVTGLALSVRDRVRERCGVTLVPEVEMWGDVDAFARLREGV